MTPTQAQVFLLSPVVVTWLDAELDNAWVTHEDLDKASAPPVHSLGFLVRVHADELVLVSALPLDKEKPGFYDLSQALGEMTIPLGMVQEIRRVRIA